MINTKRPGVGVVIGRFQVADLHEGHHAIIEEAKKHHKTCVFIGVNPSQLNTMSDPLDYPTREQMVKLAYPDVQVYELFDQYTDDGWSKTLDQRLKALYPRDPVTLYAGRDSFNSHYTGKFKVFEIDSVKNISGTNMREIDGRNIENHASFRRGAIYAAYNRWPSIFPCVDIACTRKNAAGELEVLVGFRKHEGGVHRFPGGHIDPTDATDEAAARRELHEETGVEAGPMNYLWSGAIKTWVDREGGGKKRTIFFHCEYQFGPAQAADDLDGVKWVPVKDLLNYKWGDSHRMMAEILQKKVL